MNSIISELFQNVSLDYREKQFQGHLEQTRKSGTLAVANGCFDLLHPGHIASLRYIHALTWLKKPIRLVVLVNSDASVAKLKGPKRPFQPLEHRLRNVAAIKGVYWACGFSEETPEKAIQSIRPKILLKGEEYCNDLLPGEQYVSATGGMPFYTPMVDEYSTTMQFARMERVAMPLVVIAQNGHVDRFYSFNGFVTAIEARYNLDKAGIQIRVLALLEKGIYAPPSESLSMSVVDNVLFRTDAAAWLRDNT